MGAYVVVRPDELYHHGVLGMHWGVRRYQPYPKGHAGGKEVGQAKKVRQMTRREAKKLVRKTNRLEYKRSVARVHEIDSYARNKDYTDYEKRRKEKLSKKNNAWNRFAYKNASKLKDKSAKRLKDATEAHKALKKEVKANVDKLIKDNQNLSYKDIDRNISLTYDSGRYLYDNHTTKYKDLKKVTKTFYTRYDATTGMPVMINYYYTATVASKKYKLNKDPKPGSDEQKKAHKKG